MEYYDDYKENFLGLPEEEVTIVVPYSCLGAKKEAEVRRSVGPNKAGVFKKVTIGPFTRPGDVLARVFGEEIKIRGPDDYVMNGCRLDRLAIEILDTSQESQNSSLPGSLSGLNNSVSSLESVGVLDTSIVEPAAKSRAVLETISVEPVAESVAVLETSNVEPVDKLSEQDDAEETFPTGDGAMSEVVDQVTAKKWMSKEDLNTYFLDDCNKEKFVKTLPQRAQEYIHNKQDIDISRPDQIRLLKQEVMRKSNEFLRDQWMLNTTPPPIMFTAFFKFLVNLWPAMYGKELERDIKIGDQLIKNRVPFTGASNRNWAKCARHAFVPIEVMKIQKGPGLSGEGDGGKPKRKRIRYIHGSDVNKFYQEPTEEEIVNLNSANILNASSVNEIIFNGSVSAIQKSLRTPGQLGSLPDAFWVDPIHLKSQYEAIFPNADLSQVDEKLTFMLDGVKVYLERKKNDYIVPADILRGPKESLHVHLLSKLGQTWDKSPFIMAEEEDLSLLDGGASICSSLNGTFTLAMEGFHWMKNLTLTEAVKAYFEIIYLTGAKYAKKRTNVSILLQEAVMNIRDGSPTPVKVQGFYELLHDRGCFLP